MQTIRFSWSLISLIWVGRPVTPEQHRLQSPQQQVRLEWVTWMEYRSDGCRPSGSSHRSLRCGACWRTWSLGIRTRWLNTIRYEAGFRVAVSATRLPTASPRAHPDEGTLWHSSATRCTPHLELAQLSRGRWSTGACISGCWSLGIRKALRVRQSCLRHEAPSAHSRC